MGLPGAACDAAMTAVHETREVKRAASSGCRLESVEKFFPLPVFRCANTQLQR